jgi:hypothetical protein
MIDHTPLDLATLSPAAQRALVPGPARTMASRGMLPLLPVDQLCVLYQLALDGDAAIAATAHATAANLPDKLLAGTLADPHLDPRVLDLFAKLAGKRSPVFDALARNATTADDTMVALAEQCSTQDCELIATNEQRVLRCPAIIAALYANKHARMSTVDRLVELAVRNGVRVPDLAAWDEIARALQGAPPVDAAGDAVFATEAVRADDSRDEVAEVAGDGYDDDVAWSEIPMRVKVRLAATGSAKRRMEALRDPKGSLAVIAIKSAKRFKDSDVEKICASGMVHEDVIRHIAGNAEYTKAYSVKVALCRNPKTPIANAAHFLPHLHERELTAIASSRNVPSATVANAKRLLMQRKGTKPGKR